MCLTKHILEYRRMSISIFLGVQHSVLASKALSEGELLDLVAEMSPAGQDYATRDSRGPRTDFTLPMH